MFIFRLQGKRLRDREARPLVQGHRARRQDPVDTQPPPRAPPETVPVRHEHFQKQALRTNTQCLSRVRPWGLLRKMGAEKGGGCAPGTQRRSSGSPSSRRPGDLSPASVQPARVVSEAGPEVRASWKRGCHSRGVATSAGGPVTPSPPVTFTKRTPARVHSGWQHRVPRGVGTGPPTPGQTGASRKRDCSQFLLSGSAWLKIQNTGPRGGEKKGRGGGREKTGPHSPILSLVMEPK